MAATDIIVMPMSKTLICHAAQLFTTASQVLAKSILGVKHCNTLMCELALYLNLACSQFIQVDYVIFV